MRVFELHAVDTLFFGDSRPFNSGEGGGVLVESLFPPHPRTVVGALRAAFAHGQGWQEGDWDTFDEGPSRW